MKSADGDSLERVAAEVIECRACPRLVEWRELVGSEKRAAFKEEEYWARPIPGFGDPSARLVIVGLAPAAHGANRTGRMFTGDRSGDFLYAALHRRGFANQPTSDHRNDGLRLTDCYLAAPVKCAPPANKPLPEERAACAPYLARELTLLQPKVLIALGLIAHNAICDFFELRPRPKFGHGNEALINDHILLDSYHVSQQNTFTGKLTPTMFDEILDRARAAITA